MSPSRGQYLGKNDDKHDQCRDIKKQLDCAGCILNIRIHVARNIGIILFAKVDDASCDEKDQTVCGSYPEEIIVEFLKASDCLDLLIQTTLVI